MLVILPLVAGERWPRRMPIARAVALVVLGVSSIWAVEAFAYTAFTFAAMVAMEAWLGEPDRRRRWLLRQLGLAVAACVAAHLIFALATLAAVGQLPHWGQYLAFVRALLLGGREGSITYGFANWSPGLAMGAACLASAAAVVLLVRRIPAIGGARRTTLIALTGTTAYGIASFSYTDNRSSTYLLLYVALPMLMAAALWLGLLLDSGAAAPPHVRLGGLSFALCVAVLMLAAAWPAVGSHFSQSALAHAYPGGGLRASLHRLWHPPPIDPRAPEGQRLLRTYLAGRRPLLVLPDWYDLGIEMEMRGGLANPLFVGDPSQDGFVPSVWIPKVRAQLAALRAGQPILTDVAGLRAIARLRGRRSSYALAHPALGDNPQQEWILHQIDLRFVLQPIYVDRDGFVVARLVRR
jgi:hypothetical protein